MGKKSKRKRAKKNRELKKSGNKHVGSRSSSDDEGSIISDTTSQTSQYSILSEDDDFGSPLPTPTVDDFGDVLFDLIENIGTRKKEIRMKSLKTLYKIFTQKFSNSNFVELIDSRDDINEIINKLLKKLSDQPSEIDESILVLKIYAILKIVFYDVDKDDINAIEKDIEFLYKRYSDFVWKNEETYKLKENIIRTICLLYFLFFEDDVVIDEVLEKVKKKFLREKKINESLYNEVVGGLTVLVSLFDNDDRLVKILPMFESVFIKKLKSTKRFVFYNSIGEFYNVIYDDNNQIKRKMNVLSLLNEYSRSNSSKNLRMEQKRNLRKYIKSLENEYDLNVSIQLDKKHFMYFEKWKFIVRYNFFKKFLKSNVKHYVLNVNILKNVLDFKNNTSDSKRMRSKREKEYDKLMYSERSQFKGITF